MYSKSGSSEGKTSAPLRSSAAPPLSSSKGDSSPRVLPKTPSAIASSGRPLSSRSSLGDANVDDSIGRTVSAGMRRGGEPAVRGNKSSAEDDARARAEAREIQMLSALQARRKGEERVDEQGRDLGSNDQEKVVRALVPMSHLSTEIYMFVQLHTFFSIYLSPCSFFSSYIQTRLTIIITPFRATFQMDMEYEDDFEDDEGSEKNDTGSSEPDDNEYVQPVPPPHHRVSLSQAQRVHHSRSPVKPEVSTEMLEVGGM